MRIRDVRNYFIIVLAAAYAFANPARADIASVEVPADGGSVIYNAANVDSSPLSVDLTRFDYIEAEFFISGTASSYTRQDDRLVPLQEGIAYTTRIVVRRPRNLQSFSGVMHFEAAHPAQGSASHWYATSDYILSNGDAYVLAGLGDDELQRWLTREGRYPTSQTGVLKWFDAQRYSRISWPEEDGIRWQVMGNILQWLRSDSPGNPFHGHVPQKVIAGGWSFTGSLLRTFINQGFHEMYRQADGGPLIDAYLIGISSRWNRSGLLPLASTSAVPDIDDPLRDLKPIDVPVIEFLTEFEVALGDGPQRPDSDHDIGAHRLYEVGGAIHSDQLLLDKSGDRLNRPNLVQLAAKGYPAAKISGSTPDSDCPLPLSDVPLGPLARAVLHNLRLWIVDGTAPPHALQLRLDRDGKVLRDHHGNPLGGIPIAEFALPTASYDIYRGAQYPQCARAEGRPLLLRQDFPSRILETMYGSRANYLGKYDDYVDSLLADRWLLPADTENMKKSVRRRAESSFGGT